MLNWNEKRQAKWREGTLRYADAKVAAACAERDARIAELEAANDAFAKRQEWWNARMVELEKELAEARKDAERYRFAADPQSDGYAVCEWNDGDWIPINTEDLDAAIKEQT